MEHLILFVLLQHGTAYTPNRWKKFSGVEPFTPYYVAQVQKFKYYVAQVQNINHYVAQVKKIKYCVAQVHKIILRDLCEHCANIFCLNNLRAPSN